MVEKKPGNPLPKLKYFIVIIGEAFTGVISSGNGALIVT
jgi:hypothetical protein